MQVLMYALFMVVLGALSVWPRYELIQEDRAIISLAFSHAGERVGECRQLTQEELNELPPNMRTVADCPRERHPLRIEFRSGDELLYGGTLLPSGIWADGKANIYQRVEVQSGKHEIFVGMNDSGGSDGFDYSNTAIVELPPGRNLLIQFDEELRQFLIR